MDQLAVDFIFILKSEFNQNHNSFSNVAKCNLGKVKFKTMPVSGRPTLRLRGDLLSSLLGVPRGLLCICLLAGLCERPFC